MKIKKIIFIIVILLIFILVTSYMTITKLYEKAIEYDGECCSCGSDNNGISLSVCCECNYNVFEKLGRIIDQKSLFK